MSDENIKASLGGDGISSALGEIFSNPEMLSAISSMAEKLKAGESRENKGAQNSENSADEHSSGSESPNGALTEKLPEIIGMLSQKENDPLQRQRADLLYALKPYLSKNRCDAIDRMIRISELSSVFKNLS